VGTAEWTGTPLAPLLREAGIGAGAVDIAFAFAFAFAFAGADHGVERGVQQNYARVPGWYGMAHVTWLVRIELLDRTFSGCQNQVAYRLKTDPEDPGEPVSRIRPRALLTPPGWPTS
jgi:DMSO/TMAO reductase YedYZ molybdopterin-dependent catalytic subunit